MELGATWFGGRSSAGTVSLREVYYMGFRAASVPSGAGLCRGSRAAGSAVSFGVLGTTNGPEIITEKRIWTCTYYPPETQGTVT